MAVTNINTILSWFKTGLKPTQAQFWASWLSFWHKDETIPQSSVSNLTTTLAAKAEKAQFDAEKIATLHKTGDEQATGIKEFKTALLVGLYRLGTFLTTGRHLSQFNAGPDQTPISLCGGNSSIEYFKNELTPREAWATGLQNPSDNGDPKTSFKWFYSKPENPAAPYAEVMKLTPQGNLYTKGNLSEEISEFTPTISGQPAIIKHVKSLNTTQPARLVIYFHGSGANQLNPFVDNNSKYVIDKLLSEGFIVATSQAHSNAWGNQASQDDYLNLYNYLNSSYNIIDVAYVGHSMGGLASLSMLSKNTIPKAKIWYGIMPVTNLLEAYGNPMFTSAIETAYGFSGSANYAAATAGYDPQLLTTSTYLNKKYTMTASPGDVSVVKTTNSDLFNAKLLAGTIQSSVVTASGVHGDLSHFIPKHIYAFIRSVKTAQNRLPKVDSNGDYVDSAILDDGANLNFERNARIANATPVFSLINTASGNKRYDNRVSGNDWMVTESGVGNHMIVKAGGEVLIGTATATGTSKLTVGGTVSGAAATLATEFMRKGEVEAYVRGASYTPALTAVANVVSLTLTNASYTRIGNIITATIGFNLTVTSAGVISTFTAALPIVRSGSGTINLGSGGATTTGAGNASINCQSNSESTLTCFFVPSSNTGTYAGTVTVQYLI